jgi:hypothetical protein
VLFGLAGSLTAGWVAGEQQQQSGNDQCAGGCECRCSSSRGDAWQGHSTVLHPSTSTSSGWTECSGGVLGIWHQASGIAMTFASLMHEAAAYRVPTKGDVVWVHAASCPQGVTAVCCCLLLLLSCSVLGWLGPSGFPAPPALPAQRTQGVS